MFQNVPHIWMKSNWDSAASPEATDLAGRFNTILHGEAVTI
jgi:hypothetical protein